MELKDAQQRIAAARKKQRELVKEIRMLRKIITKYGVKPNPLIEGVKERNKKIYKLHTKGWNFTKIAPKFDLTPLRKAISAIG